MAECTEPGSADEQVLYFSAANPADTGRKELQMVSH